MAEPVGQRRKSLRQLDHRAVREPREQACGKVSSCARTRRVDARIRVAEEIDPPRAHRVEIAAPVEVDEPRAVAARDRNDGSVSCTFIWVHGCHTAARLRASHLGIAVGRARVCQGTSRSCAGRRSRGPRRLERSEPRVRGKEYAARRAGCWRDRLLLSKCCRLRTSRLRKWRARRSARSRSGGSRRRARNPRSCRSAGWSAVPRAAGSRRD